MILDQFVTRADADASETHSRFVAASPDVVYAAVRELRASELSPIVGVLMAIRAIPGRLFGPRRVRERTPEGPFLTELTRNGFAILADTPEEIVFGLIAKPWQLTSSEHAHIDGPQHFLAFDDPTMAKTVGNLVVRPAPGGSHLSTETRVRVVDPKSRAAFLRYWVAIRLGSGMIRRLWLRAIAKRAMRASRRGAPCHAGAGP